MLSKRNIRNLFFLVILLIFTKFKITQAQYYLTEIPNLSFQDIPYGEVFDLIEKAFQVSIYYKDEWFVNDSVNFSCGNCSLYEVLNEILYVKQLVFERIDDLVFIMPKVELEMIAGQVTDHNNKPGDYNAIVIGNNTKSDKNKEVKLQGVVIDG